MGSVVSALLDLANNLMYLITMLIEMDCNLNLYRCWVEMPLRLCRSRGVEMVHALKYSDLIQGRL